MSNKATIWQLPLGPLQTNCYLLGCNETREAAIIDPAWDGRLLAEKAAADGWRIICILLTHSHFDHVGGLAELQRLTGAPVAAHPEALPMLENSPVAAQMWQISIDPPPPVEGLLGDGDEIEVGDLLLQVLYTPGHAPGHVSFYLPSEGVVFDGDVLFQQGIGRTDLPGGDYEMLMASIRERLLVLGDDTAVLSGHGPSTTIGAEKTSNPFLT